MKLRPLVVAVTAFVALVAPLLSESPASAADEVVVTWPTDLTFNPDLQPFVVHVDKSTDDDAWVYVDSTVPQQVPDSGDVIVQFPDDGRQVVTVARCQPVTDAACVVGRRTVEAYTRIVTAGDGATVGGPKRPGVVTAVVGPSAQATVSWSVVDSSDVALGSGQSPVELNGGFPASFEVSLPATVTTGQYTVRWRLEAETIEFGHLESIVDETPIGWDADPNPGRLSIDDPVAYPAHDGYKDNVAIVVSPSPGTTWKVVVVDQAGKPNGRVHGSGRTITWSPSRAAVPGTYRARLTATDPVGNVAVTESEVDVLSGRLEWIEKVKTFRASALLVDQQVGRCSTLKKLPRGALGLYSRTKCSTRGQDGVAVIAGVHLPDTLGMYDDLRVDVLGGKAKGEKDAFAILQYFDNRRERYFCQQVARGGTHTTRGCKLDSPQIDDVISDAHDLFFAVALSQGSRFDLRSFTVRFRMHVLR